LLDPEFRRQVLADDAKRSRYADTTTMISTWDRMYVLPADLSYEPSYPDSIAGIAEAQGIDVREVLMDVMARNRPILFLLGGYLATFCGGELTYERGEHTGAMPGRLVRGGRPAPR